MTLMFKPVQVDNKIHTYRVRNNEYLPNIITAISTRIIYCEKSYSDFVYTLLAVLRLKW